MFGSLILHCCQLFIYNFRINVFLTFSRLVNKLGDPVRAVASKAIHLIGQLLENHPAMTAIVMEEIGNSILKI